MKNAMKLAITVLAAAVLALPLSAQTTTYRVDIPFEFTVANTTLPAGQYEIGTWAGGLVLLQGGSSNCYFSSTLKSGYASTAQQPKIVFNRYGDRYFLSAIQTVNSARQAPASRDERELKSARAARPSPAEILLALR